MSDDLQVTKSITEFEVDDHYGMVVLKMRTPREVIYTTHDPQQALEIATAIGKASYHARYGKPMPTVVSLADQVIERKRDVLINRGNVMINSMLRDGKSNQDIVRAIIDVVLAEVT